jgi:PAS domain S-box-containing protein
MAEEMNKLLIIEDDEGLIRLIQRKIRIEGYEIIFAKSGNEALKIIPETNPDLILLDYMLPDLTGTELIENLLNQKSNIPFIMMTGHGDEKIAVEIMKKGAYDYIIKDTNFLDVLPAVIKRSIDKINIENELEKAHITLQESEERYRMLVEHSPVAICVYCEGKIVYVNSKTIEILRAGDMKDILGKKVLDFVTPKCIPAVQERMRILIQEKIPVPPLEEIFYRVDGTEFPVEVTAIPTIYDGKRAVQVVIQDITERKHTERTLLEDAKKYKTLFEGSSDGIFLLTDKIIDCNEKVCKILGYERAELINKHPSEISPPYQSDGKTSFNSAEEKMKMAQEGKYQFFSWQHLKKDGSIIDMEISLSAMKIEGETIIQATMRDITDRLRYEKELKKSKEVIAEEKERLSVTLRSIGDGVITTNTRGKIVLVNRVAEEMTGYSQEEALGKDLKDIFNTFDLQHNDRLFNPFEKTLEMTKGKDFDLQAVMIDKKNNTRIITNTISPIRDQESKIIGFILVFCDITDKQKLEEEILKNQKLESIGILAGGIAHDFNNILTGIIGNISLAKLRLRPEEKVYERLVEAEKAGLRAKDLTQQLLTFSKGGAPIKKATSISDLITDSVNFSIHGSSVICHFDIPNNLWTVEVDEGQINQVLNNLTINAIQSMPTGGILNIIARNIIGKDDSVYPFISGKYIQIDIKDQGIGIPKEHLNKIFDPFFTTKQKGSGLGLATTHSIIQKHNGQIFVESEIGQGTVFRIFLPAIARNLERKKHEEDEFPDSRGKILLMDDDELIRDVAKEMFTELGFEISFTVEGHSTIAEYKRSNCGYDIVILDLTIPGGLGGKDTLQRLLEVNPEVKAIVSSGYSNDPVMSNFREYGFKGVISKPYNISEVRRSISKVLNHE